MDALNTLRDFYRSLNEEFNELYFEVLKDFNVTSVHNLRVNIKKQNAFFHLLESIDPDFEATESKVFFYKIFKNAGEIRKIHIEQDLLNNEQLDPKSVKKIAPQLQKKLKKNIDRFLYHNNTRSLLAIRKMSPEIESQILGYKASSLFKNLNRYFQRLIKDFRKLAKASLKTKKVFHDLRKLLKELIYNFGLIKNLFPETAFDPELLAYISNLQSELGQWHDLDQTLKSLQRFKDPPIAIIQLFRKEADTYVLNIREHLKNYDAFAAKFSQEIQNLLLGE